MIYVFVGCAIVLFFSYLAGVLHFTYDFSIIRPILGQIPSFVVLILYLAYIKRINCTVHECKQILFDVFLVQAIIQLCSMLSPSFHQLIEAGQDPMNVEISHLRYGGMRNMALASNQFFSLASVYGLIVLIYMSEVFKRKIVRLKDYVYLGFYAIGVILSGRTGFFGFVFGLLFLFFYIRVNFIRKIKIVCGGMLFLGLLIAGVFLFVPEDNFVKTRILPFAFEFLYNYFEGEGLRTESTRGLFTMLDRDLSLGTFLFGDGWYTNQDGSYYMHTDSGYFRLLYLYGIGGLFLFFYFQLTCFPAKYFYCQDDYRLLVITIIGYLLLLQVKGEALGYIKYVNSVLYYFFTSIYLVQSNNIVPKKSPVCNSSSRICIKNCI